MDIKFAVMQVLEAEDGIALDNAAERDRLASAIASALRTRLDVIVRGHQDALRVARNERDVSEARVTSLEDELRGCRAIIGEDVKTIHRVITERDAARTWARLWKRAAKRQRKQARRARTWREVFRREADMHATELDWARLWKRAAKRHRANADMWYEEYAAELQARTQGEDEAGAVAEPPFPMIGVGR